MEKEDKKFMMEETALGSENQEDGELSPEMKNIVNGVTDMLMGTLNKFINNPNAGKSLSDIIGEAVRKDNEDEENDEETE